MRGDQKQEPDGPDGFHRLRYEEMRILAIHHQVDSWGCGYMREPRYNTTTNIAKGYCPIREILGKDKRCVEHVPMDIHKCIFYQRWLAIQQKEIKKRGY